MDFDISLAEILPIIIFIADEVSFTMPSQITCPSALPDKMGKNKSCIFHSSAVGLLVHCQNSTTHCLISSTFLTQDS